MGAVRLGGAVMGRRATTATPDGRDARPAHRATCPVRLPSAAGALVIGGASSRPDLSEARQSQRIQPPAFGWLARRAGRALLGAAVALSLVPLTAAPQAASAGPTPRPTPRPTAAAPLNLTRLPLDLHPLVQELQRHGFRLRLEPPPRAGVYGEFVASSRTLWLAPIALELGIGRQTLLHEAVHALQSCPSGRLTPLGWRFRLDPVVQREISGIVLTRYHHSHRLLELEAFGLQGQPDAVARLIKGLRQRCRPAASRPR